MAALLLPWAQAAFVCTCRTVWERMKQDTPVGRERAVSTTGHILHSDERGYFQCCALPFRWVKELTGLGPAPDDYEEGTSAP